MHLIWSLILHKSFQSAKVATSRPSSISEKRLAFSCDRSCWNTSTWDREKDGRFFPVTDSNDRTSMSGFTFSIACFTSSRGFSRLASKRHPFAHHKESTEWVSCHAMMTPLCFHLLRRWLERQIKKINQKPRLGWVTLGFVGGNFTPPLFSSHSCLATKTRFIPIWPNWKAQAWRIYTCGGHMQGRLVKFPHIFFPWISGKMMWHMSWFLWHWQISW